MKLALVLTLCLLSSATATKTRSQMNDRGDSIRTHCTCEGMTMDCSSKGKTTFSRNEGCKNTIAKLILRNNSISSLPRDAFASMSDLTQLHLQQNKLQVLPRDIFSGLIKLDTLFLDSNHLESLPEGIFQGLDNLMMISLWGNKLQTIPSGLFTHLPALSAVSLSDNQLTTLPVDTFSGISSMELIDLSRNKLTRIPRSVFRSLKYVKYLDLSGNQLTQISPEDLVSIRDIYRLDLSGNKIVTIPSYNTKWPQIQFSFWSENEIERMNEEVLRSWLGDGDVDRVFSMDAFNATIRTLFPPEDVKWVVADRELSTEVDHRDCRCGKIKLRKASVALCVKVECGSGRPHADWVSALRALSGVATHQGEGAGHVTTRGKTKS